MKPRFRGEHDVPSNGAENVQSIAARWANRKGGNPLTRRITERGFLSVRMPKLALARAGFHERGHLRIVQDDRSGFHRRDAHRQLMDAMGDGCGPVKWPALKLRCHAQVGRIGDVPGQER
jgi:hypothetical protein